jgi:hypothetical protein
VFHLKSLGPACAGTNADARPDEKCAADRAPASTLALGLKGMIGGLADDPCWGAERIDSRRSVSAQADDADRANTRNCDDSNPEVILFV